MVPDSGLSVFLTSRECRTGREVPRELASCSIRVLTRSPSGPPREESVHPSFWDRLPSRWYPTRRPVAPADYRAAARARMPAFLWRYLEGAAGERRSFDANLEALGRVNVRGRVLSGLSAADTERTPEGAR